MTETFGAVAPWPLLPVALAALAYFVSRTGGRIAAGIVFTLPIALALRAGGSVALRAPEIWLPLLGMALLVSIAELHWRSIVRRDREATESEKKRQATERDLVESVRLSRALAAVASGLQSSFEPSRMLARFTTLVRALLRSDAVVTLVAVDAAGGFRIAESSADGHSLPPESRATIFPLRSVNGVGIVPFSFSAGEAGLFGALMREQLSASVGFGAPILRGKQLAGLLLVAYRERGAFLSDTDRSLLAGCAALGATLFESVRLHHELGSSNRVKAEFISTVSHELRTPLNAIIGYCDLLRDGTMGEINDDQRDALDRLMRHSVEFAELIQAILEVDRLEGGYISVDWKECNLDTFFTQLRQSIPAYWRKEEVEIRWQGRADRTIRTDPEKLKLSVRNLIHNALKFTPSGTVTVEMSTSPGTLMFTVADTGIGMKPEVRESLFQQFQPGDRTTTRPRGGLGLGLYLAHRMVKALWGQISIDSVPGEGTTARIVLPIEEPIVDEVAGEGHA